MKKRLSLCSIQSQTKAALLMGVFVFILLLSAMPMGITWGDSPELADAAWVLGVPHPTGYPMYMLAAHLFQWLPFGSVIFRAHLFSVFCSALACAFLYLWLNESLTRQGYERNIAGYASILSSIAFALTSIVWSQSLVAEVYALFVLLFILSLFFFQRSLEHPQSYLPVLFFLFGLHIIHHRLALFLIVVTTFFLLINQSKKINSLLHFPTPKKALLITQFIRYLSALFPPLLFWLYLPIRARMDPPINWFDPDTLERALEIINGGQFSRILHEGIGKTVSHLTFMQVFSAYTIPLMLYGAAALILLYGFYHIISKQRGMAIYLILLYGIYQSFFMVYITGDRQVFLLPALILVAYPLAWGLAAIMSHIHSLPIHMGRKYFIYAVLAFICIMPFWIDYQEPIMQGRGEYPIGWSSFEDRYRHRWDTSAKHYAQGVWKHAKAGEIILTGLWEPTADNEYFPLLYQKHVERRGDDKIIIGAGFLLYDWYRKQLNKALAHPLEMRGDRMMATREAWLEDVWRTIIDPHLDETSVLITTQHIPPSWFSRAKVEEVGPIDIEDQYVPRDYRMYIPNGFLYRISQRSTK